MWFILQFPDSYWHSQTFWMPHLYSFLGKSLSKPIAYSPWACFATEFLEFLLSFPPQPSVSDIGFANLFSAGCHSALLLPLLYRKLCNLIKFHLLVFTFDFCALKILGKKKKNHCHSCVQTLFPHMDLLFEIQPWKLSCWAVDVNS